jgi:hypothetical protein
MTSEQHKKYHREYMREWKKRPENREYYRKYMAIYRRSRGQGRKRRKGEISIPVEKLNVLIKSNEVVP